MNTIENSNEGEWETLYDPTLYDHRFRVSKESAILVRELERAVDEQKKKYPFLLGISFFGSRMLGKESQGSDIDFVVFVDLNLLMATVALPPTDNKPRHDQALAKKLLEEMIRGLPSEPIGIEYTNKNQRIKLAQEAIDATMNKVGLADQAGHNTILEYFFLSNSRDIVALRSEILLEIRRRIATNKGVIYNDVLKSIGQGIIDLERGRFRFTTTSSTKQRKYYPYRGMDCHGIEFRDIVPLGYKIPASAGMESVVGTSAEWLLAGVY